MDTENTILSPGSRGELTDEVVMADEKLLRQGCNGGENGIGLRLGQGVSPCSGGTCWRDVEYSVPGNIHYGYIGEAAGILGVELHFGAGWAEASDPAHDPNSKEYTGQPYEGGFPVPTLGPTWWDPSTWNFGDDPKDHEAVMLGLILWREYGEDLTRGELESELAGYIGRLARCAPNSKPVSEMTAQDWPYPVGYFDNRGHIFRLPPGRCQ